MALDTGYTQPTYNSYIDEFESDEIAAKYAVYYPNVEWIELSSEEKEAWLLNTAHELNTVWGFESVLVAEVISTQSGGMQWPRRDADYANGLRVPPTEVPDGIKEYQVVRAFEYISNPSLLPTGDNVTGSGAVKKQKLDVLEQEFFNPSSADGTKGSVKDFLSYQLIEPFLNSASRISSTGFLVRA